MVLGQQDPPQETGIRNGGIVVENGENRENEQQPTDSTIGEDVWDEERLEKALKLLKQMHIQVSSLNPRADASTNTYIAQRLADHDPETYCTSDYKTAITYARNTSTRVPKCSSELPKKRNDSH